MADVVRDSSLQTHTHLFAPVVRAYGVLRALHDYYGPLTWLLLYYPLFYLAKINTRLGKLNDEQDNEDNLGSIEGSRLLASCHLQLTIALQRRRRRILLSSVYYYTYCCCATAY